MFGKHDLLRDGAQARAVVIAAKQTGGLPTDGGTTLAEEVRSTPGAPGSTRAYVKAELDRARNPAPGYRTAPPLDPASGRRTAPRLRRRHRSMCGQRPNCGSLVNLAPDSRRPAS
jgi:hypothetical protein